MLLKLPNTHVISIDEKTGIQALERHSGRASKNQGRQQRMEFEYTRHGTTTLMAAIQVENGQLLHQQVGQTRDEKDFADFTKQIVKELPEMDKIVLLADQLNTQWKFKGFDKNKKSTNLNIAIPDVRCTRKKSLNLLDEEQQANEERAN